MTPPIVEQQFARKARIKDGTPIDDSKMVLLFDKGQMQADVATLQQIRQRVADQK